MSDWALAGAAALMGLAGLPHCAAMCAAPCTALTGGSRASQPLFQAARVAGYAVAGAVAAWGVGALREGLALSAALRPLWTLLHLLALAFGLWMLAQGRWPAWMQRTSVPVSPAPAAGWQRLAGPLRSTCIGAVWIAWPCALSQSALLVAALADTPQGGAATMAVFALASAPGLLVGPLVLAGVARAANVDARWTQGAWPLRTAGALLAAGSAWALGHGLMMRALAWCFGG
jgi:sulfite exporter TauE/SafE